MSPPENSVEWLLGALRGEIPLSHEPDEEPEEPEETHDFGNPVGQSEE